jgi:peptide/nickel transport system substrate-binding protein
MFTHQFKKRWSLLAIIPLLGLALLAACQPAAGEPVEVTRIVTETVTVEGEAQEVTRVITETVVVPPEETEVPAQPKDLIVCMAQEPDTLYPYGGSMLAATAVQVAIFETEVTTFSYDYQALGIEKLPNLEDGDAVINQVEVNAGDLVLDASGNPATLEAGVSVINADGETVEFDGSPITMQQLSTDFTLKPRVWSDGTPVTAADSVYSFELNRDPDTPAGKFIVERTASYEATGELGLTWTGIPGFLDPTYFLNVFQPMPQHIWGQFSAAELLEAEEAARLPVSDGAFHIVEWVAGDSIRVEPNPFYYRQNEGLPYLDSVTFKFIQDTNQLIAQLISGACDIGTQDGLTASDAPFLIEAENNGLITPYFQTGTVFEHIDFGINSYGDYGDDQGRPDWFEDARVRQAMTMCTDRQGMVDNILFGRSEVIHTYVPSVHPLYPEEGLTELPYDVEEANALLDEVGFIDNDGDGIREYYTDRGTAWEGEPFVVNLGTTTGNDMRQQMTQIFKANMLDCGIDVVLYYVPASEWFADGPDGPLFGRRYDLGEFAWVSAVQPSCNLYLTSQIPGPEEEGFSGWGSQNNSGWSNEAFDQACNTALSSLPGTPEYEENHKEAQRIFSQEVPVIPAFLRLIVAAARPNVVGFSVDPTGGTELQNIYQFDLEQ